MDYNGTIKYANYKSPLDSKRMRGMVFKKLLERNQITSSGSGVLIRRKVFNVVGLFDENLRYAEDWDMWLRITQKFEVDFNPSILVHIRKHENNMTFDTSKTFENELHFYSKWISIIEGSYPAPFFWADKITFRLLSRLPSTDLISVLKNTMLRGHRKKIFRASFGSFLLYIPIFLIRQIWNAIFYPGYLQIFWGLIRHAKI
jgi:GT2 family glycosyltransferase